MGQWTDVAAWAGPIPNCGPGAMTAHVGVVIHTAEGSYDGTIAWQRNPSAEVGSHFVTAKDGRCVQLVDTGTRSWCQVAGNDTWISIENEGFGSRGEALTASQVEKCAQILAKANQVYGVPLQVSNSPSTPGLGWHGMGGTAWGGHFDCPGTAIRAQLPAIVARAAQIAGGNDMASPLDDPTFKTAWDDLTMRVEAMKSLRETQADGPQKGWPVPFSQTINQMARDVAASKATDAANATAIAGLKTALDALAAVINKGSGNVDVATITAAVQAKADEVKQLVEQRHAEEMAALKSEHTAQVAALQAQIDALNSAVH